MEKPENTINFTDVFNHIGEISEIRMILRIFYSPPLGLRRRHGKGKVNFNKPSNLLAVNAVNSQFKYNLKLYLVN